MGIRSIITVSLCAALSGCTMSGGSGGNDNAPGNDNGGNDNGDPGGPTTRVISMINIAFVPDALTIRVGDTVRWRNDEGLAIIHTVTSGVDSVRDETPLLDSGDIPRGGTFEFTFTERGEFIYFCEIHPGIMTNARITVEP